MGRSAPCRFPKLLNTDISTTAITSHSNRFFVRLFKADLYSYRVSNRVHIVLRHEGNYSTSGPIVFEPAWLQPTKPLASRKTSRLSARDAPGLRVATFWKRRR